MIGRVLAFLYGIVAYCIFLIAFLYAVAFVGNIALVPMTMRLLIMRQVSGTPPLVSSHSKRPRETITPGLAMKPE